MAWPAPSAGYQARGSLPTTIAWGTDGVYAGVIVKSVRAMRMIEEIKVENGTGITATQVLLNDGDQVEITVVDDRSVSFPDSGGLLTLINPISGVASPPTEIFQMINNDYNAARKQEGERVFLAKRYTLITPS
jgi:hypothetical protein